MTSDPFPDQAGPEDRGTPDPALVAALKRRIVDRTALAGVIGLGYVGLPLSLALVKAGYRVLGFDIDAEKVRRLGRGESYIRHIESDEIAAAVQARTFLVTDDFSRTAEPDVLVICVPTPLNRNREPDMSFIEATGRDVGRHIRLGQLVILESSTFPGTTSEVLTPRLEATGLKSGQDFFTGFSPEREDPGNQQFETVTTPKIVSGDGAAALELCTAFYGAVVQTVVPVSSTRVAESAKLLENIFRAVNIALVNELKVVLQRMDIDVWEVIAAASTKPFGFMPFYPGPGLGGHCIPIDPFYLTWKAREFELSTHFIELAGEINTSMPRYVVARLAEALSMRFRKAVNGARVLVIGLAYKKNVDDIRESPSLKLIELLRQQGADVDFHDPFVQEIAVTRRFKELVGIRSVAFTPEQLSDYDAAIIVTDHDVIDYAMLVRSSALLVDTRNAIRSRLGPGPFGNVVLA